jgi:hypothetical protein
VGRSVWVRINFPPPGFDLRNIQPIASRYTDYAIWTHACRDSCSISNVTFLSSFPIPPYLTLSANQKLQKRSSDQTFWIMFHLFEDKRQKFIFGMLCSEALFTSCIPGTREHTISNSEKGCICNRRYKNKQCRISVHWKPQPVVNMTSPYFVNLSCVNSFSRQAARKCYKGLGNVCTKSRLLW